jgi:GTPase SAR1 family protein
VQSTIGQSCRYLAKNLDWLEEELGEGEDDYYLIDCPGQIELFTHMKVMNEIVEKLELWNSRVCAVFLLDANFLLDGSKFISGAMTALAAMVNFAIPHVNVITKMDQLSKGSKKLIEK